MLELFPSFPNRSYFVCRLNISMNSWWNWKRFQTKFSIKMCLTKTRIINSIVVFLKLEHISFDWNRNSSISIIIHVYVCLSPDFSTRQGRHGYLNVLCQKLKQDQGSKAPSRDHPNSSFITRLDYIRVED